MRRGQALGRVGYFAFWIVSFAAVPLPSASMMPSPRTGTTDSMNPPPFPSLEMNV